MSNAPAVFILTLSLCTTALSQVGGKSKAAAPPQPKTTSAPAKSTPAKSTGSRTGRSGSSGSRSTSTGNSGNTATTPPVRTDPAAIELAYWESIKSSTDPMDFRAYLKKYPDGQFADLARNRLVKLETPARPRENTQPVTTTATTVRPVDPIWSRVIVEERFNSKSSSQFADFAANDRWGETRSGKFFMTSQRETGGGHWVLMSVPLNQNDDFKIECTTQKVEGADNFGYGIVWGVRDASNYYGYVIAEGVGKFTVYKWENGKRIDLIAWTEAGAPFYSVNKLTIIKEGSQMRFLLNDHIVGSTQFQPFFGDYMGPEQDNQPKTRKVVAFDDFIVAAKR